MTSLIYTKKICIYNTNINKCTSKCINHQDNYCHSYLNKEERNIFFKCKNFYNCLKCSTIMKIIQYNFKKNYY